MTATIDSFPFWPLEYAKDGTPTDAAAVDRLVTEVKSAALTDLFIFSHGWNNDHTAAMSLYTRFFTQVGALMRDAGVAKKRPATLGVVGVLWPSILWPDDAPSDSPQPVLPAPGASGGVSMRAMAAGVPSKKISPEEIRATLAITYDAAQQAIVSELTAMLAERQSSQQAIDTFKEKLEALLASERPAMTDRRQPDDAEGSMTTLNSAKWRDLLEQLGDQARERGSAESTGGVVGLGNPFAKLWDGAKDALRIATYWQMKNRAGVVGTRGLGAVLERLAREVPGVRVHLLGHSFGARLVSFSLCGLSDALSGTSSPVKSLFLMQGAFSHYAFADKLPADASRSGALKGMSARVDGPLLTTHTLRDYAVGVTYPAASMVNGDDASAFDIASDRWGAMGHDGAKGMNAASAPLAPPGQTYTFAKGAWLNLDANNVIIHGSLPAGAHGDIVHPHTAWAALAAAGVV